MVSTSKSIRIQNDEPASFANDASADLEFPRHDFEVAGMSCPKESDDSTDYGSDFTPEEEQLLSELLDKAAGPATGQAAILPSTPFLPSTPVSPKSPALLEFESLHPEALAALVADIEDAVEEAPVRLPKVLGRERPRAPWRSRQSRPGQGSRWSPSAVERPSARAGINNRPISSGMLVRPSRIFAVTLFLAALPFHQSTKSSAELTSCFEAFSRTP